MLITPLLQHNMCVFIFDKRKWNTFKCKLYGFHYILVTPIQSSNFEILQYGMILAHKPAIRLRYGGLIRLSHVTAGMSMVSRLYLTCKI